MKLDYEKAINFLLYAKFKNAHDRIGKSFDGWCEEKGLTKAEKETSKKSVKVCNTKMISLKEAKELRKNITPDFYDKQT